MEVLASCQKNGKDLTHSYDNSPYITVKSKKQRDNARTPLKMSIRQQFTESKPSHLPQKLCNQKDTHLKIKEIILL